MHIRIELLNEAKDWTISRLLIDGRFECFTLEDEGRLIKVRGETRIPATPPGQPYEVKLLTSGRLHEAYLKKFGPDFHRGMLHITNVPGFEGILFHIGNTDEDTDGCPLVGQTQTPGFVGRSERAYRLFYPKVRSALLRGERVTCEVDRTV